MIYVIIPFPSPTTSGLYRGFLISFFPPARPPDKAKEKIRTKEKQNLPVWLARSLLLPSAAPNLLFDLHPLVWVGRLVVGRKIDQTVWVRVIVRGDSFFGANPMPPLFLRRAGRRSLVSLCHHFALLVGGLVGGRWCTRFPSSLGMLAPPVLSSDLGLHAPPVLSPDLGFLAAPVLRRISVSSPRQSSVVSRFALHASCLLVCSPRQLFLLILV